jgi:hypothetical protein
MTPDFDELIGTEELAPGERERLRHVHELLLQAGPPPELPPSLVRARVHELGPRARALLVLVAATLAIVVFGVGYLVGRDNGTNAASFAWAEPLHATAAGPSGAAGTIEGTKDDSSGNWRMRITVSGLERLPASGYYVVYLVRHGKKIAPCGFFKVAGTSSTTVQMNVPYRRTAADGWIVLAYLGEHAGPALLTT